MELLNHRRLTDQLLVSVLSAARFELSYFQTGVAATTTIVTKADASPVTIADQKAEAIICSALRLIAPGVTVIAEEDYAAGGRSALTEPFFLVDALDGTKNFIAGDSDFTINIALVAHGVPVYGLVYAPAKGELFVTDGPDCAVSVVLTSDAAPAGLGACELSPMRVRPPPSVGLTVLLSKSRVHNLADPFYANLPIHERQHFGSSYKFCLVAQGTADLYVQLGGTCEWDTAAGDALVRAAGGCVRSLDGASLVYGGAGRGYVNQAFVAASRPLPQLQIKEVNER
jgi:3'(2'), 5'-bisphosphate nucleotidase